VRTALTVVWQAARRYRRLNMANLAQFEGSSVHYWPQPIEGGFAVPEVRWSVLAIRRQAAVYLAAM